MHCRHSFVALKPVGLKKTPVCGGSTQGNFPTKKKKINFTLAHLCEVVKGENLILVKSKPYL